MSSARIQIVLVVDRVLVGRGRRYGIRAHLHIGKALEERHRYAQCTPRYLRDGLGEVEDLRLVVRTETP